MKDYKGQFRMPTVTVEGVKSFEVEAGKKLVLAIEDAGIDILHKCGGNCRCTTCRVQVISGHLAPIGKERNRGIKREVDPSNRVAGYGEIENII